MNKEDFLDADTPSDLVDLHFGESTFGLVEFSKVLEDRFSGATHMRCLEVGSGAGFLLTRLSRHFPQYRWEGIEPIGQGFSRFRAASEAICARYELNIHRTTFEEFESKDTFDFIFSLNVIEHVDEWRDFVVKAHSLLSPRGVAVFLCPNYTFPYEPHYAIPIVLNKSLTARVFRRYIADYDRRNDTTDLWASLNFIKRREVVDFCRKKHIKVSFDDSVMTRMVEKLWTDEHFAERQRLLATPAKLLHRMGVTRLLEHFPLNRVSPYSKIVIES